MRTDNGGAPALCRNHEVPRWRRAGHPGAGPPGFQLPAYAPELNPVEAVWSNLKRSLANLTKRRIDQLVTLVKTRLKRMQYRPSLIEGFLAKTGLDLTLS
jgi:transposase